MQPELNLIKIGDNRQLIQELLTELVLEPRINALKWSNITHQTPNIKIGYPGQHLASLITGMQGQKTGARGDDLEDGTEVKSCSRIDQMDKCKECKFPVARSETYCGECGSSNIDRKNDSKWLFTIRSDNDLKLLTEEVPRILLILGDYPNFDSEDYETLRFQAFEIWNNSSRYRKFKEIMTNYYYKIYLPNKQKNPKKTPAPKNFWPYSYQFYLCNPICTFSCTVYQASHNPKIKIDTYIEPSINRESLNSILMPSKLLNTQETEIVKTFLHIPKNETLPQFIDENCRKILSLRDTDKGYNLKTNYSRTSSKRRQNKKSK